MDTTVTGGKSAPVEETAPAANALAANTSESLDQIAMTLLPLIELAIQE